MSEAAKRYTFRTEGPGDKKRAEALIQELQLTVIRHWREQDGPPGYYLDFYTVLAEEPIEVLRQRMENLVWNKNDRRFADLHRCHQTLAEGDDPKAPYS